jgi:hypothetical protein
LLHTGTHVFAFGFEQVHARMRPLMLTSRSHRSELDLLLLIAIARSAAHHAASTRPTAGHRDGNGTLLFRRLRDHSRSNRDQFDAHADRFEIALGFLR